MDLDPARGREAEARRTSLRLRRVTAGCGQVVPLARWRGWGIGLTEARTLRGVDVAIWQLGGQREEIRTG